MTSTPEEILDEMHVDRRAKEAEGRGLTEQGPRWTPGPWRADGLQVIADDRGVIAKIPTPHTDGTFDCEANARLIAAVPELYEALREQIKYLETFLRRDGSSQETVDYYTLHARAALAKADGK